MRGAAHERPGTFDECRASKGASGREEMTKTTMECLQVGDGAVQEDGEDIGDEVVFEAGTGVVVVDARRREAMQPPGLVQGPGHTSIPSAKSHQHHRSTSLLDQVTLARGVCGKTHLSPIQSYLYMGCSSRGTTEATELLAKAPNHPVSRGISTCAGLYECSLSTTARRCGCTRSVPRRWWSSSSRSSRGRGRVACRSDSSPPVRC